MSSATAKPRSKNHVHPHCWACGERCPVRVRISRVGWVSRPVVLGGAEQRETYCPTCFEAWGWPDEPEGESRE